MTEWNCISTENWSMKILDSKLYHSVIHRVRHLKIQRKHRRGKRGGTHRRIVFEPLPSNCINNDKNILTHVQLLDEFTTIDKILIKFGLANVRSLKGKSLLVNNYILEMI